MKVYRFFAFRYGVVSLADSIARRVVDGWIARRVADVRDPSKSKLEIATGLSLSVARRLTCLGESRLKL
jgi:hypothetical protein